MNITFQYKNKYCHGTIIIKFDYLFVRDKMTKEKQQVVANEVDWKEVKAIAEAQFGNMPEEEKSHWEAVARSHLERQKRI